MPPWRRVRPEPPRTQNDCSASPTSTRTSSRPRTPRRSNALATRPNPYRPSPPRSSTGPGPIDTDPPPGTTPQPGPTHQTDHQDPIVVRPVWWLSSISRRRTPSPPDRFVRRGAPALGGQAMPAQTHLWPCSRPPRRREPAPERPEREMSECRYTSIAMSLGGAPRTSSMTRAATERHARGHRRPRRWTTSSDEPR